MSGILYVVATPIGNLGDMTYRAVEVLQSVDAIACENRERHLKLLNHYGIKKRLFEYSPSNEKNSAKGLVALLEEGKNLALTSDAGVPALSDPGKVLVEEARAHGIQVIPIPGASALTTLLSVSGNSCKRVIFLGFLAKTPGKQEKELKLLKDIDAVLVIFVSQYQIKKLLESVNKILGNVEILIGREMTKVNEEFLSGKVEDIIQSGITEKGEFTLAVFNQNPKD